jgi:hypothetical protein
MMRRPGQQVKSLPVIYVTKPFWAGMFAWPFPPPPSMIAKRHAIRPPVHWSVTIVVNDHQSEIAFD